MLKKRWGCTVAPERTYPCVMRGGHIRELTTAQMQAEEWRRMSDGQKIAVLLERIENLEADVRRLQENTRG